MGVLWQTDASSTQVPKGSLEDVTSRSRRPRRKKHRLAFWSFMLVSAAALGYAAREEMRSSWLQSREISRYAATLTYRLDEGPSDEIGRAHV